MNFYLAAVDEALKHPGNQPSIGLILCKTRQGDREYALRGTSNADGDRRVYPLMGSQELKAVCRRLKKLRPGSRKAEQSAK